MKKQVLRRKTIPLLNCVCSSIFRAQAQAPVKKYLLFVYTLGLLSPWLSRAQLEPSLRFRRYGIEEGLSQVTARCLLEDKIDGHIWIGTQDGLNQFDGYRFKVFKHHAGDPTSLSSNRINTLFQDRDGRIWVGTDAGLDVYLRHTESFVHISPENAVLRTLSQAHVTAIAQDAAGHLWVGTENGLNVLDLPNGMIKRYFADSTAGSLSSNKISTVLIDAEGVVWVGTADGLNRYDHSSGLFTVFRNENSNPNSLSNNEILSMHEDAKHQLWIGTIAGLNLLDRKKGTFKRFVHEPDRPNTLTNDDIRAISQDQRNGLWIGTRWGGVNILDLKTDKIQAVVNQVENQNSLSNNTVLSMLKDSRGNMWVGVSGRGLNVHDPRTARFIHYHHMANNPNSLLDEGVWGAVKDHEGNLWVATFEGASVIEPDGRVRHFRHDPNNPRSLISNQLKTIIQDKQQRIWIGSVYGLNLYDPKTRSFTRFRNAKDDPFSLSHDEVTCIYQDKQNRLWIGTEGGLNELDARTGKFKRYALDGRGGGTNHFRIKCITQDTKGHLWIGTDGGVNVLNPETGMFKYFTYDANDPHSLASNIVKTISLDKTGNVFIGTERGLSLYDIQTLSFKNWSEDDGLSNNVIYGILIDEKNNLWLSTNMGLNKFNTITQAFTHYDKYDGLQSDEFNTGSYYKDRNGNMYFGGINGLTVFHPDSIRSNTFVPPVLITDFQLFNQSVSINDSSVLTQSLRLTNKITLEHDDDIFAFIFAALSYEQPEKIKYAYKLEPFHRDWIYTDYADRKAVLTKIPAGEYTFKVKAANSEGIWSNESTNILVRVLPPWYNTAWARGFFIVLGIALVIFIIYIREINARITRRNLEEMVAEKTLQLKAEKEVVSKQLAEKEILMQEVHHRVKNNMTFLKGLLYLRAKASDDRDVKQILYECQARIESMALVHQNLYDMEDSSNVNFELFLQELFVQLMALMDQDSEKIEVQLDVSNIHIDMKTSVFLGLILNELITNSFKYAFGRGKGIIYIQAVESPTAIEINYSDSGKGLPKDFDLSKSGGFGFKMIRILNDQLGSDFQYIVSNEKIFKLSIPKK